MKKAKDKKDAIINSKTIDGWQNIIEEKYELCKKAVDTACRNVENLDSKAKQMQQTFDEASKPKLEKLDKIEKALRIIGKLGK